MINPTLEAVDSIVRIFGIPAIVGALVWVVRVYDRGTETVKEIHADTKANLATTTAVQTAVDLLATNHMKHMGDDIKSLSVQGDKQIEALQSIDSGIKLLVDRGTRGSRQSDR